MEWFEVLGAACAKIFSAEAQWTIRHSAKAFAPLSIICKVLNQVGLNPGGCAMNSIRSSFPEPIGHLPRMLNERNPTRLSFPEGPSVKPDQISHGKDPTPATAVHQAITTLKGNVQTDCPAEHCVTVERLKIIQKTH